jgi:hypothetical protein
MAQPWNHNSHVSACPECEGSGVVAADRRATIDDPYPEKPCDCGRGEHEPECPVCGFTHVLPGYDCLVCETVAVLPDEMLSTMGKVDFIKGLIRAFYAARSGVTA